MPNQRIADLIAAKLRDGVTHPGDMAAGVVGRVVQLPVFRTAGLPKEVAEQVDATVKVLAEAIVHTIEVDGDSEIVPRTEVSGLRTSVENAAAGLRPVTVHCRCDGNRRDPLIVLMMTNDSQIIVDGKQLLGGLVKRSPECPHEVLA